MNCLLEILFLSLISLFSLVLFCAISFAKKEKSNTSNKLISLAEITLLIPYRNEKNRILPLLNSLKNQQKLPKKIIFIDDHSTDGSSDFIIENTKNLATEIEFISLPKDKKGKKYALFFGIKEAKTALIQTMDADVFMNNNYFTSLERINEVDMLVLPVNMTGKGFIGKLMELEYGSFELIQKAFGKRKPMMASGANLIFKREKYLAYNNIDEHIHFASGDDQFLLHAFLKNNLTVKAIFDEQLYVTTFVPDSLKTLFQQRLRWMSKNNQLFEWRSFLISIWVFLIQVLFVILSVKFIINNDFEQLLSFISLKIVFDFIQYFLFIKKKDKRHFLPLLPILSIAYPIYLWFLVLFSFVIKPNWKDRNIIDKKD